MGVITQFSEGSGSPLMGVGVEETYRLNDRLSLFGSAAYQVSTSEGMGVSTTGMEVAAGSNGFFDIDFITAHGCVYMIEMNFRQSGNAYALKNNKTSLQDCWALAMTSQNHTPIFHVKVGECLMSEMGELPFIKHRLISIGEWMQDVKQTKHFAIFYKYDVVASLRIYSICIGSMLVRNIKSVLLEETIAFRES